MNLAERKLSFIQGLLEARYADNQTVVSIKEIQDMLDLERFYQDGLTISEHLIIRDYENPEREICIVCKEEYLDCILYALNSDDRLNLLD